MMGRIIPYSNLLIYVDMESQHHTFFSSLQERCLLLCCKILSFFREELKGRKEDNVAK